MNIYEKNIEAIEILFNESLNKHFNKDDLFRRLKYISDEFDKEIESIEERLQSRYFSKSCLHKIFKVHERVRLVRHFENQLSEGVDILPRFMYPGLITYLLLTCFDQLGQNEKGWRDFPSWLTSKKCKLERDSIFSESELEEEIVTVDANANPKYIESIYYKYNKIYGVKNSFMNFLRSLLPREQRDRLLNKIQIEVFSVNHEGFTLDGYGTELEKEDWLFKLRNNYTHNLLTVEKHFSEGFLDFKENWIIWEEIHAKGHARRVLARESLKKEIEESILTGIAVTIKNNS